MTNPRSKKEMVKVGRDPTQPPVMAGRHKPYTERGIVRMACARCGKPAKYQWAICSDNNLWRPICSKCDVALNRLVLKFFRFSNWKEMLIAYEQRMEG